MNSFCWSWHHFQLLMLAIWACFHYEHIDEPWPTYCIIYLILRFQRAFDRIRLWIYDICIYWHSPTRFRCPFKKFWRISLPPFRNFSWLLKWHYNSIMPACNQINETYEHTIFSLLFRIWRCVDSYICTNISVHTPYMAIRLAWLHFSILNRIIRFSWNYF